MNPRRWMILMICMLAVLLAVLFVGLLAGCARDPANTHSDGITNQVSDPQTGVVLRTHIDRDELSTADRVRVELEIEWTPPTTVSLVEPDWTETQWTLIETHTQPARALGDGFVATSTYLIEPFLDGQYTIPPFQVDLYLDDSGEARRIESMPMTVQVQSVLDTQDAGELDPVDGFLDPRATQQAEPDSDTLWFIIAGGAIIIAIMIFWRLGRSARHADAPRSVYHQLESVAHGTIDSRDEAYETLYHAFIRLDRRLQQTSEIRNMIDACERARFSPMQSDTLEPQMMAQHTLELLGEASKGAA